MFSAYDKARKIAVGLCALTLLVYICAAFAFMYSSDIIVLIPLSLLMAAVIVNRKNTKWVLFLAFWVIDVIFFLISLLSGGGIPIFYHLDWWIEFFITIMTVIAFILRKKTLFKVGSLLLLLLSLYCLIGIFGILNYLEQPTSSVLSSLGSMLLWLTMAYFAFSDNVPYLEGEGYFPSFTQTGRTDAMRSSVINCKKTAAPAEETAEKLLLLKDAYESGVLSEEEYQKKRAEILDKI